MPPSPARTPPCRSGSAQLQSSAYVEQLAREEFGLVMPGEQAYGILLPAATTTTTTTTTPPRPKTHKQR